MDPQQLMMARALMQGMGQPRLGDVNQMTQGGGMPPQAPGAGRAMLGRQMGMPPAMPQSNMGQQMGMGLGQLGAQPGIPTPAQQQLMQGLMTPPPGVPRAY